MSSPPCRGPWRLQRSHSSLSRCRASHCSTKTPPHGPAQGWGQREGPPLSGVSGHDVPPNLEDAPPCSRWSSMNPQQPERVPLRPRLSGWGQGRALSRRSGREVSAVLQVPTRPWPLRVPRVAHGAAEGRSLEPGLCLEVKVSHALCSGPGGPVQEEPTTFCFLI